MKIFVKGKGDISLTKRDFLASGGQGDIYIQGDTAFKIYQDPKNMIPLGKIQELSNLKHPNIIKPEQVINSNTTNGPPIGYTMRYVSDTYALCQLFTKSFRDRNGISPKISLDLLRKLQEIIQHIHEHNILIVDLNELNFLSSQKFDEIYAIDVDSYQTFSYPAVAIMDNIRDRHSTKFSKETDWFSFAVIGIMLMIGIHPYKGKHTTVKDFDDRMKKNISIFNSDVSIPKSCLPFDVIPEIYRKWFKAILEDGKRLPPPIDLSAVAQIITAVHKTVGSNNFDIKQLFEFVGNIIETAWIGSTKATLLDNGNLLLNDKVALKDVPVSAKIGITNKNQHPVVAYTENNRLKLKNAITGGDIILDLFATDIMDCNGRLYIKNSTDLVEIQLIEVGNNIIASPVTVAQIMEHASKVFDGILIQNLLGAIYVSILPASTHHEQIRIKELDHYRIVDAKYSNKVLMTVCIDKKSQYDKLIFRFSDDFKTYDIRKIDNITYTSGINFAALDNGVCIHLNDDEDIEVFHNKKDSSALRVIDDTAVTGDMKLFSYGAQVLIGRGNQIFSMTMKKAP